MRFGSAIIGLLVSFPSAVPLTVRADPAATIYWGAPSVFSLTSTNTQLLNPYVGVVMNGYTGQTHVSFSADADVPATSSWTQAFDGYGGSMTQLDLAWPGGGVVNVSPFVALNPGWLPPSVTNVHKHWEGIVGHVYQISDLIVPDAANPYFLRVGAPIRLMANAAPTVRLIVQAGFWSVGKPVVLLADGHDAEADLWSSVYLEHRWDFESDGTWDTGWSRSNQITNTFSSSGVTRVSVQVVDRGYAGDVWQSDMSGETWTSTVTNYVLSGAGSGQPALSIAMVPGGIQLAWQTNEVPYRLLEASDVGAASWTGSTNSITSVGGTNCVVSPFSTGNRFYRLGFP